MVIIKAGLFLNPYAYFSFKSSKQSLLSSGSASTYESMQCSSASSTESDRYAASTIIPFSGGSEPVTRDTFFQTMEKVSKILLLPPHLLFMFQDSD